MNGSDFRFGIRVGGVSIQFIPVSSTGEFLENVRDAVDYAAMLDEMMGVLNEDLRNANPHNGNVTIPPNYRNSHPAAPSPVPAPVAVPGNGTAAQWPAVAQSEIKLFDKELEMEPYAVGTLDMATAAHYRSIGQQFQAKAAKLDVGHGGSVAVYFGTRQWPDIYIKPNDPNYARAMELMTQQFPCRIVYKIGNPKKNGAGYYYDALHILLA